MLTGARPGVVYSCADQEVDYLTEQMSSSLSDSLEFIEQFNILVPASKAPYDFSQGLT
jgi:hypothetical protein